MAYLPINQYGLIGDLHTAALVGSDGRVAWLPWPRFDSPSLCAALLDDERGGDWLLAPAASAAALVARTRDAVISHVGDAAQFDDITMLCLRRDPA